MTGPTPSDADLDAIDRALRGVDRDRHAGEGLSPSLQSQLDDALAARSEILSQTGEFAQTQRFAGRRVGPFELEERIGRGAQGEVWRAIDRRDDRVVALKLVAHAGDRDDVAARRFRREAELAGRLRHPSLCPVYDAGEVDGSLYLAMRFVAGPSLVERCTDGLPDGERIRSAITIAARLADGLAAAHAHGILHRDVKPSNVRIDGDGTPVLVDFGLARDELAGASLTGDAMVGTPAYMPPEALLATGEQRLRHEPRGDIWSLGVTLFELVTGQRPFGAPTREGLYHAITCAPAPDPSRINPSVSPGLAAVLATCLAKDPDQRYADAATLAADLRRLAAGQRPLARAPGPLRRTLRWLRGNPLATAVGTLLVALLVSSLSLLLRAIEAEQDAQAALASERVARRESDGMRLIATARTLAERSPGLSLSLALLGVERCPDARADEAVLKALQQPFDERVWDLGRGTVHALAFAADGARIACVCADGSAHVLAVDGGERHRLVGHGSAARCVTFVGDDRVAIGHDDGRVVVWQPASGATHLVDDGDAAVVALAFDAGRLACGDADGRVDIVRAEGDRWLHERRRRDHEAAVTSVSWYGDRLVSSGDDGRAILWNTTTDETRVFAHPMPRLGGAALSADGATMLCASEDNRLWGWDAATGARRFSARGHASGLYTVAAHPSAPFAVTTSFDRTAILWHTGHGRVVRRFAGHGRPVVDARFSPDGAHVATASDDGSVRLWSTHAPPQAQRVRPFGRVVAACFGNDGRHLIVSGDGTAAGAWRLADGERAFGFAGRRTTRLTWACPGVGGERIYVVDGDGRLRAVDAETGEVRRRWQIDTGGRRARYLLQPSADGDQLLVTDSTGEAHLFDLRGDAPPRQLRGLANFYNVGSTPRAAFLGDGARVATIVESGQHSYVVLWDRRTGRRVAELDAGTEMVLSMCAHPAEPVLLLACVDGVVRELHVDGGASREHPAGSSPIASARYDHAGKRIVAADQNGGVWLWSDRGDAVGQRVQAHESVVYDVRFDPSDRRVLSVSWDGSAALWHAETRRRLLRIDGHGTPVIDARFSPDGDHVVTVGDDDSVHTWPCDPVPFVRARHRRSLTDAERARWQLDARTGPDASGPESEPR